MADDIQELLYVKRQSGSKNVFCGYKREILAQKLNAVEEGLVFCLVCKGILRNANINLGEITCLQCVHNYELANPVKRLINVVFHLQAKCPFVGKCDWVGSLSEVEIHLKGCLFMKILCQCNNVLERKDMPNHMLSKCKLRKVKCDYCKEDLRAEKLAIHSNDCPLFPILCSNGCGERIVRDEQRNHIRHECQLTKVDCPYRQFGCDSESLERNRINDHKQIMAVEHMDILIRSFLEMKLESARLANTLEVQTLALKRERQTILCSAWDMISMKCLDGVEWKLESPNKLHTMRGPIFYLRGRMVECYSTYSEEVTPPSHLGLSINCCLMFFVKMLPGEIESDLFINECRSLLNLCGEIDSGQFEVQEIKRNLSVGRDCDVAEFWLIRTGASLGGVKVRLYFDLSSATNLD